MPTRSLPQMSRERRWVIFTTTILLLTPSTAIEAPVDLVSVTMSSFNRMWTLMHGPTMTLPAATAP